MSIGARVVVAVAFQQVDIPPPGIATRTQCESEEKDRCVKM